MNRRAAGFPRSGRAALSATAIGWLVAAALSFGADHAVVVLWARSARPAPDRARVSAMSDDQSAVFGSEPGTSIIPGANTRLRTPLRAGMSMGGWRPAAPRPIRGPRSGGRGDRSTAALFAGGADPRAPPSTLLR